MNKLYTFQHFCDLTFNKSLKKCIGLLIYLQNRLVVLSQTKTLEYVIIVEEAHVIFKIYCTSLTKMITEKLGNFKIKKTYILFYS